MAFASRGFFGSDMFPTAASKFMSVAAGSGGVFSTSQRRALGYLVNGLSDLGIGNSTQGFLIYPFVGNSATNNALNLFSASTTALNLTFVGSPTHSSAGVTFNGTTQYAQAPSLAIYSFSLNTANISFGFCTTSIGAGTYIPLGYAMNANLQTKTYSTAGTYSFNPNVEAPGITAFTISAFGGGGAGGGTNGTTSNYPGGGGAGGNYATRAVTLTKAQGATSMTIVVGSGGTGVTGANGNSGGNSTVVHPNFTGIAAGGGQFGSVNAAGAGGAGGTTSATLSGGTTFAAGGGAPGGAVLARGGAGGGSSAGTGTNGNNGTTATGAGGGAGGTAPTGGVAGGSGGANGSVGNPGTAGGGGGGGAGSTTAGNNRAGGAGGDGLVTVSWTPATQKRNSVSIFGSNGQNIMNCDVGGDATSRFMYTTTPFQFNGVRVGSRRANAGLSTDMGFYVANNAASALSGPLTMSTTSFDPSPLWYIGAVNNWASTGGAGNTAANFYSGALNFGFIGPAMTDGQLQSLYTLITTYNTILGR